MSIFSDIANRIRQTLGFERTPRLNESVRDYSLEAKLNRNNVEFFENPSNYNEYCRDFFSNPRNFEMQYDYVDLISQMETNGAMDDYKRYLDFVYSNEQLYYPSQVHGIAHTNRVTMFAEMLTSLDGLNEHDKNLIMVAASLHDIGREDDRKNLDHGAASVNKIRQMNILGQFSPRDQALIEFAIANHSLDEKQVASKIAELPRKDRKEFAQIINYLQDADKLDRTRIANPGWGLDPTRLATTTAKRLVKVAHTNFYEFDNMLLHQQDRSMEKEALINHNKEQERLGRCFQIAKQHGFNITFEDFQNIVSEYKPGTLEMFEQENRIPELFSYQSFMKYRKEESFEDRLDPNRINPDQMFKDLTQREQVELARSTFDSEFMLFYNLKKNDPEGYDMMCYIDVDYSNRALAGLAHEIRTQDIDRFRAQGVNFRLNDLFRLARGIAPEEYRRIMNSDNIFELFDVKHEKLEDYPDNLYNVFRSHGLNYDREYFDRNYALLAEIGPNILSIPNIGKYSLVEIYAAKTKLSDALNRITDSDNRDLSYNDQTVIDLIEYTRKNINFDSVLTEDDRLDVVKTFVRDEKIANDPRYINYKVKKNKPFAANTYEEMIDYKKFGINQILLDNSISLDVAKSKFVHLLFDIDAPMQHLHQHEKEFVNTLYYHRKYSPDSTLYQYPIMDAIESILDADNITELKNKMFEQRDLINSYNTADIGNGMRMNLMEMSKGDIARKLQETSQRIDQAPYYQINSTSGRPVNVKVLSGEDFTMATFTAMPKCSSTSHRMVSQYPSPEEYQNAIYKAMYETQMDPSNVCTSITTQDFIGHAKSALNNQELIYGYVPESADQISLMGSYDLSTTKKYGPQRTTNKAVTPRTTEDFIENTSEEHNEMVVNGYPRYIVCFDQITDIAVAKQQALQRELAEKGINQTVDIVFVDGKNSYLPMIRQKVLNEHSYLKFKLQEGKVTEEDLNNMFGNPESNLVSRTLRAIHSSSYSDNAWNMNQNQQLLDSMADVLDLASAIIPDNRARDFAKMVDIAVQRSDRNSEYGRLVYDHAYDTEIQAARLQGIRNRVASRATDYEQNYGKFNVSRDPIPKKIVQAIEEQDDLTK